MKDLLLVLLGGLVGMTFNLFLQPLFEERATSFLVRLLGSSKHRGRKSISGSWDHRWSLNNETSFVAEEKECMVKQLHNRITTSWVSHLEGRRYVLVGDIEQERYVTGKWFDQEAGPTYSGTFQLIIHLGANSMTGKWIGYDDMGRVRSGIWEWKRSNVDAYGSEDAS
ncbi:hypothetical protein C8R32_102161 [Nitrosospira sp. Nsp5]|uniref:Uncharacterized protein n=1 Tax=Nitrosospira multiformis TaxID=1231 RepID=A0ABY0TLA0_9PROT|nr:MULTISPECIES: hypothetical protein [Nitrosospira]PTR10072.1 hypothetical protein C8R32_102161 [Nitrosospira sp. Nsp5]SDQ98052.1 hypothetical protein SAMN05216402_3097 [Nitrosospira multiformis]